ncbi:MAG: hypothetical protein K0R94_15 [Burkholderiales bacterium]|jgi:hypothetical protein|nr:hypothetical protein [Burkholderiales bacterium]
MKKIMKLFLLSALFSITSLCFATQADDEEFELRQQILNPIFEHFQSNPLHAPGKLRAEQLINKQIEEKTKYDYNSLEKVPWDTNVKNAYQKLEDIHKERRIGVNLNELVSSKFFAEGAKTAWDMKSGTCNDYADLVKIIFEFNILNDEENDTPSFFTKAIYIKAEADEGRHTPTSGNHVFILIQGKSGTLFAVDAFENQIKRLRTNFLDTIKDEEDKDGRGVKLSPEVSKKVTELFSQDGVYDILYIRPKTQWLVTPLFSKLRRNQIRTYDPSMAKLYKSLQSQFKGWFDYYELKPFKGKNQCKGCSVS